MLAFYTAYCLPILWLVVHRPMTEVIFDAEGGVWVLNRRTEGGDGVGEGKELSSTVYYDCYVLFSFFSLKTVRSSSK